MDAETVLNDCVSTLPLYNTGLSEQQVKDKYAITTVVKLGSNENPYGPSKTVGAALAQSLNPINIYPDATASGLRNLLGKYLDINADQIILGNGSEDLISIAARTFLNTADEMVTVFPDFGLHTVHSKAMGATVRYIGFRADHSFDVNAIEDAVKSKPKLLCISSPSNPVGSYLREDDLRAIAGACGNHTTLLLDEAYHEYGSLESDYPDYLALLKTSGARFLLLRTFSKAYGLAGLRIGYGIASDAEIVDSMHRIRTPFNVNCMAQVAAQAALADQEHVAQCCSLMVVQRKQVFDALSRLDIDVIPSAANFFFCNADCDSITLADELLKRGVIVKPWTTKGYETYFRVSIGTAEENALFITSLSAALQEEQCKR